MRLTRYCTATVRRRGLQNNMTEWANAKVLFSMMFSSSWRLGCLKKAGTGWGLAATANHSIATRPAIMGTGRGLGLGRIDPEL